MISDVLSEAVTSIEEYQRSMPKCYRNLGVEIGKVTTVMNALRVYFDCPPADGRYPRYDAAMKRLRTEIAAINVDGLLQALDGIEAGWPTPEEAKAAQSLQTSH